MSRVFWPPCDPAQADYETLREAALAGTPLVSPQAARFHRGGLAALIARPGATAAFSAILAGMARPAWTPYLDPRLEALADGYDLVVAAAGDEPLPKAATS